MLRFTNYRSNLPEEYTDNQFLVNLAEKIDNYSKARETCKVFCCASTVALVGNSILSGAISPSMLGVTVFSALSWGLMHRKVRQLEKTFVVGIHTLRTRSFTVSLRSLLNRVDEMMTPDLIAAGGEECAEALLESIDKCFLQED